MAHTFRNKNTVPVGWTVRDNGLSYLNGNDVMGRNTSTRPPKYRRSFYRCEQTSERRNYNRTYRAKTNHLVRIGRWDDILPPTGTSGWLSW
jgi:hypothetical protein